MNRFVWLGLGNDFLAHCNVFAQPAWPVYTRPLFTIISSIRPVLCKCGLTLPKNELHRHEELDCPLTIIFCSNMCGVRVERRKLPEHLSVQCQKRFTACPNSCGILDLYLDHVRRCALVPIVSVLSWTRS